MTDQTVFQRYSQYYDLLYKDKDYIGEAKYISNFLSQHGIPTGELLEFGSGTGKHGNLLTQHGYTVHGIEQSREMVARSHLTDAFTCQQGDIAHTSVGRTFNAVLSLFHVMSYQTSNTQLKAVFANAARHLKPDGLFVFDFWYTPAIHHLKPEVRVKRMTGDDIEIVRIAEPALFPNENKVDVNYTIYAHDLSSDTITTFAETHPMRHFSLQEIDLLAEMHGFERIAAEEFQSGHPPGENTWGVCVALKRI